MRKMRHFGVLFLVMITTTTVLAQTNKEALEKYNLFKGDYKAKNYDAAYKNWMWCMDNSPKLSVNIYKLGMKIAEHRLKKASPAQKEEAKKLVERVYTQRIKYYPKDLGKVYSDYASFKAETGSSDTEVFELLQKAYNANPVDMSAKNIYRYFDAILNKYKDTNTQKVFDTYDEIGEGIEKKIAKYSKKLEKINAKDSTKLSKKDIKKKKTYGKVLKNLSLVETGLDAKLADISTCDRLVPFLSKNFEANKTDATWLRRSVSRMYNKDCTNDPLYDQLVEAYAHAADSPDASVYYGGILMKKGQTNKAMEYYKKAVDQETDSYKKAGYLLRIAKGLSKKGRKSEARNYAYKALKEAPSMGRAYLLISSLYASSANSCGNDVVSKRMVYVAAYNKAAKAKKIDPSISGVAGKYMKSYRNNFPTKKDLFVAGLKSGGTFTIKCWIGETVRIP